MFMYPETTGLWLVLWYLLRVFDINPNAPYTRGLCERAPSEMNELQRGCLSLRSRSVQKHLFTS